MMKKKALLSVALTFAMAADCIPASAAANLDGWRYQGIAKIKGQPIDCWVDMRLDDTDIDFNVAEMFKFGAEYTVTSAGDKMTVSAKVPGSQAATFSSTDAGSSLQGKVTLNGQMFDMWVLKVPAEPKASSKPAEELAAVVGAPDGYTSFVLVGLPGGQLMSATSDFVLDAADNTFKMTCDTPTVQQIFSNMHGSYRVEGSELVLTDSTGKTVRGNICDDGYYITVPIGSAQGISLSLVLIR